MNSQYLWRGLAGVAATLLIVSCGEEDNPSGPDPDTPFPHATPSALTMSIDVSELSPGGGVQRGVCHGLSALAVVWANANVIIRLAIPTAAFAACLAENPVYLGEETWRWTANGGVGANAWTAELEANPIGGSEVAWVMRISGTAQGHDRLLWFGGISDPEASAGEWTYYDPTSPDVAEEVIHCEWTLPEATGEDREVIFENRIQGSDEFGDQLRYEIAGTSAAVSFVDLSEGTTAIQWDTATGTGSTRNAAGETCCWSERPGYDDIPCP